MLLFYFFVWYFSDFMFFSITGDILYYGCLFVCFLLHRLIMAKKIEPTLSVKVGLFIWQFKSPRVYAFVFTKTYSFIDTRSRVFLTTSLFIQKYRLFTKTNSV